MELSELKYKILTELTKHIGRHRAIGMEEMTKIVFGEVTDKNTRTLRRMIDELRKREALPVCSIRAKEGNGYYLAGAGKELEDYCIRLRNEALRKLSMEAKLRNLTLPQLMGQITLNL